MHWGGGGDSPIPDWSIADYRAARLLLLGGARGAEQVAAILRQSSPGFPGRHAHPDNYLRRTVHAAASLAYRPAFSRAPIVLDRGRRLAEEI